ncbi:MAG: tRNA (adenosine(37)-N6)-dimethylallyltransferase MiaA [Thermodesulfobacteriota bacterium]|nr:tRNA (adenosine(37)-N6)-dimethylallyltransferase MiaA [Thermodesulfobacteriota bacterium]
MGRPTPLIILTGPTCSGKTALLMEQSLSFPLEVVSADSMQIYRHMDIATAKPSPNEQRALPHHLVDIIDPAEEYDAGVFMAQADKAIANISSRSGMPVVAGGTGLYIDALVNGLSPAPRRSNRIRHTLERIIDNHGTLYLYHMIKVLDPQSAKGIAPQDASRIIRLMEVILISGKRPSRLIQEDKPSRPRYAAEVICIMPDREDLYRSIDKRVLEMMDKGLIEETQGLLDMGYSPEIRPMKALAYRHILAYLSNECTLEKAVEYIQRDTRRYAKRQITWIKGHHPSSTFYAPEKVPGVLSVMLDRH